MVKKMTKKAKKHEKKSPEKINFNRFLCKSTAHTVYVCFAA